MSEIEELREVVREAHAAIKDLTRILKESREERGFIDTYMDEQFETKVDDIVKEGLDKYKVTIETAIADAEKAVFDRFDKLGDVLLGEDWESRKNGDESVPDLVARAVALRDKPLVIPTVDQWVKETG